DPAGWAVPPDAERRDDDARPAPDGAAARYPYPGPGALAARPGRTARPSLDPGPARGPGRRGQFPLGDEPEANRTGGPARVRRTLGGVPSPAGLGGDNPRIGRRRGPEGDPDRPAPSAPGLRGDPGSLRRASEGFPIVLQAPCRALLQGVSADGGLAPRRPGAGALGRVAAGAAAPPAAP